VSVPCGFCGKFPNELRKKFYENIFDDLFKQTPASVWEEYKKQGYTIHQAILMEHSYV
jgi:hypothetical protein